MAKKKKSSKKRAERRERARLQSEGQVPEADIAAQEEAADEAVERSDKAVPAEPSAREKKAPKPPKDDERNNAWEQLKNFIREVVIEAKKINWPSTDDTWKSTWVTVVVIIFLSAFMGAASLGFKQVSETLFRREVIQTAPGEIPTTSREAVDFDPDAEIPVETGTEEPTEE